MARSTYIYLVTGALRLPVAAFTVKHELKTWLARNPGEYEFWRIGDGGYGREPTVFDPFA